MAAGLGFKTFNTGDVLSAADVNGYLMQGVLVFANSTARDAAITSPQEGQFAYLKDTNVTTYYTGSAWTNLDTTGMVNPMTTTGDTIYSSSGSTPARLGIGSTGQVLTVAGGVPSWATPAAGGSDYKLIQTTTFSAVASISLNNVFTSTYENYEIYINSFPTSTADTTTFRLRASGTDATTNYESGRLGFNGSVVFSGLNVTGTDDWYIGYDGSATNACAKMTIFRPQLAEPTKFYSTGVTGSMTFQSTGGTNSNSTSYDGFTLLILTGTFTGNVSVYGLAK